MSEWLDFLDAVLNGDIKTKAPGDQPSMVAVLMQLKDSEIQSYVQRVDVDSTPHWIMNSIYNEAEERGLM